MWLAAPAVASAQVHELKKDGDAEKLVRAAFDAAAMSPAEKTIHVFVACGGDATVNAGVYVLQCVILSSLRSPITAHSCTSLGHEFSML